MSLDAITAVVPEDTDVWLFARINIRDGATANERPAVKADVSSITYQVFVAVNGVPTLVGSPGTFDPAAVIHDTLVTGELWPTSLDEDADSPGFNFDAPLSRTYLPNGNQTYIVQTTVNLTGGTSFPMKRFEISTEEVLSS